MDVRQLIASAPLIRKGWRVLPGPLRIPLLVVAGGVFLYRKLSSDEPETAEGTVSDADKTSTGG